MAIQSGFVKDALVDFTGGLSESFNLRREETLPADMYNIIQNSFKDGSLLGAGIRVSQSLAPHCNEFCCLILWTHPGSKGAHVEFISLRVLDTV